MHFASKINYFILLALLEEAMKLYQLKETFAKAFDMEATAANARKVLKNEGKEIVRSDFRCTKTWEQLLDAFGLLDAWRTFNKKREEKEANKKRTQEQQDIDREWAQRMEARFQMAVNDVLNSDRLYEDWD